MNGESKLVLLLAPVERQLTAHQFLERQIRRLCSVKDCALESRRETGELCARADVGLAHLLTARDLRYRSTGFEVSSPFVGFQQRP